MNLSRADIDALAVLIRLGNAGRRMSSAGTTRGGAEPAAHASARCPSCEAAARFRAGGYGSAATRLL